MRRLEAYLRAMADGRKSGEAVPETSFYGALQNLLNVVGESLSPPVVCVLTLRNRGAGLPDGGLFLREQLQDVSSDRAMFGRLPARGAIEVKGPGESLSDIVTRKQIRDYVARYGHVLVTNYRSFVVVTQEPES